MLVWIPFRRYACLVRFKSVLDSFYYYYEVMTFQNASKLIYGWSYLPFHNPIRILQIIFLEFEPASAPSSHNFEYFLVAPYFLYNYYHMLLRISPN